MASPEADYSESTSVVTTKPRMVEEVREELREELRLIDMDRLPPEDKLRIEREQVEQSVGDVEFFERTWRKSQPETLSEIQRAVDAMRTGEAAPKAAAPAKAKAPAARPEPRVLGGRLPPKEQRALEAHIDGTVLGVEVVFTTSRGRVVDVESKKDDRVHRGLYLIEEGGEIRSYDAIAAKLDEAALPAEAHVPVTLPSRAPTTKGQDVEAIEGIGAAYGAKLKAQGVRTVDDLVHEDPASLAERTGISEELVGKWHDMARLQAVRGIGPQYSELLVRAGVRSIEDLAKQTPQGLAKKINQYQATLETSVQGNPITAERVDDWIKEAKRAARAPPASRTAAPAPARVEEPEDAGDETEEAEDEAEEEAPKKRGLSFGKKKADAGDAPKKRGLPFRKKAKEEPAEEPADEEPGAAEEPEGKKKKFGLKFGRK